MADTLRSLAGDIFKTADVVSQLHAPLTPENLVLDRYVFLPYARTGIAAALSTPFAWTLPIQAKAEVKVPVIDDRGPEDASMTVNVRGPAEVTEVEGRQVIRAFPKVDAVDAEVDDLVHVEFDRPDLPWLFTPAGPDGQGRLVPWVTLVVTERRHIEWGEQRGATRRAQIRRDQLQPLGDAWAWAHAQVMGAKPPSADAQPSLEQRLSETNAAHNLSRLVCPRRLDDHTAYVACVVPTFLAGAQAGLGVSPDSIVDTLEPAWGTSADFASGDPASMVSLPVYYSWSFGTAEEGNFESLARNLRPAVAPPGVGRRRVDATQPWPGVALAADDPGAEIVVTGPVVSPQDPEDSPEEHWPPEASQQWEEPIRDELIEKLNRADVQAHAPEPGPPLVGPPLYGSNHARQARIETGAEAAAQPQWFRDLNLDPRNRIVGGLGTRVVQAEQEDLMAAAWNQVIGVEAANRALRLAQLAMRVSASLHVRHLSRLTDAAILSVTERVHAKVLDSDVLSVWASVGASSLPAAVTTGAFRRLARVRGPVVRAALKAAAGGGAVDELTVQPDRLTTDWVRTYAAPEGIDRIGAGITELLTEEVAAAVAGSDPETVLERWSSDLAASAAPDFLDPERLERARPPDADEVGRALVSSVLARLVRVAPSRDEAREDPQAAVTGAAGALMLQPLIEAIEAAHLEELELPRADAERLGLEITGRSRTEPNLVTVDPRGLRGYADLALETAQGHEVRFPGDDFRRNGERLRDLILEGWPPEPGVVVGGLGSIGKRVVLDDPYAEGKRERISAPALELVKKLDPTITVPGRIKARLTGGSGRMPGWLNPDWFDDLRIEPVMAHPRFAYPMYEPLHRYDREWMVPGLGLIKRPDMATLLETNNRFVEAYIVGLNHEMGRELLWREYPTDQRGTYFSSFWTGSPELVADMHELAWRSGELRSHVDPALDGRLVFLVRGDLIRRYPGVVAHAAREAGSVNGIPRFEATSPIETLFHVHLPPNVLLVGFAMKRERIDTPGEKWWFTLSENPTEPRFGLDPSRDEPISRDSLIWADFGLSAPGGFLDATQHTNLTFEGSTWGASSAQVAYLLFQLPARAAFLAKKMVAGATP